MEIPVKDALQRIESAIERGKDLFARDMSSERSLSKLIREIRAWDALNRDVLQSFDQRFSSEYQQTTKPLSELQGNIVEDSIELRRTLTDRIDFLALVLQRLSLGWSDSAPHRGRHFQVPPRIFIVHGHDHNLLFQTKDFLQNGLGLPEPIVLFQQPNIGRTIIEKFEEFADQVDAALVLLTPDDFGGKHQEIDNKSRARQNVIFELGFFVGKFGRKSGRTIVLYKGDLEIPSDLSGVVYIDVSNGIRSAGEDIRRELGAIQSL